MYSRSKVKSRERESSLNSRFRAFLDDELINLETF